MLRTAGGILHRRSKPIFATVGRDSTSLKDRSTKVVPLNPGERGMNLRYRNFHPRDTSDCLHLLESRPEYDAQLLAELPLFWKRLFDEQAMLSAVVEQCEPGTPTRIVGLWCGRVCHRLSH